MQEPIADAPPHVAKDETPLFLFICKDGPKGPARRVEHLEGHLTHVEANWRRYVVAGPMRRPGETALMGSYFLVRAADADEAWAVMRGDPYITSDLYASIELTEITPSIGLWVGGKIWADAASIAHRATGGWKKRCSKKPFPPSLCGAEPASRLAGLLAIVSCFAGEARP